MPKRPFHCIAFILLPAILLAACSGALRWEEQSYTVQEGDTLYSIAFDHDLDYRELAEWNDIGQNYLIFPGDELALSERAAPHVSRTQSSSAVSASRDTSGSQARSERDGDGGNGAEPESPQPSTPSEPPQRRDDINWAWPVEGDIINRFGEGSRNTGLQIAAEEGTAVNAAASGRVVYTGSGLIGYGKLIIIKHDDIFLSAYGHNREILVEEGDEVDEGQRIGRVGLGRGNRSMLHFEIRSEGEAVDPEGYLP
ncbi:lipoprotein NlpD [Natronospira proteinivora]|uniref:Lipoprotein NlpD n=1 Tax=Natronospira proteinivora TaxID=1807133 RepID=A0ABT1G5S5_9GAMM|nr:peptidoglycan DD-metalloendopeptidase family protein [Natronospira proteinivora]MCP1726650.1 lipoprotein NlpD [Natronospira proteinivora]